MITRTLDDHNNSVLIQLRNKIKMNSVSAVEFYAHKASEKVYEAYLKNSIRSSDLQKKKIFDYLIQKPDFVISDNIFEWTATNGVDMGLTELGLLLNKKKTMDNYINSIVDICQKKKIEYLNSNELDELLKEHGLERCISFRMHVLELLTCFNIDEAIENGTRYPVEHLTRKYEKLYKCVDEFICDAAYLANCKILKSFVTALFLINFEYKFQPSINERHSRIINWIRRNISNGEQNPSIRLGWTDGPDSGRWPSTELNDYKETLSVLELMLAY